MKEDFKLLVRYSLRFLAGFILVVILYFTFSVVLSLIPVNNDFKETPDGVAIFVMSNGTHIDIALPVKTGLKDWGSKIDISKTAGKGVSLNYVAFGWGDKGFYLNTPEWSDLKFSTAFNALFFMGESVMHVTFLRDPRPGDQCKKIFISDEQYLKLVHYIESSFQTDSDGNFVLIDYPGYGRNDFFYEAERRYNLFYTCNSWTNNALKQSNMRSCVWTPFAQGVLYQYQNF